MDTVSPHLTWASCHFRARRLSVMPKAAGLPGRLHRRASAVVRLPVADR